MAMPWLQRLLDIQIKQRVIDDPRTCAKTFLGWPRGTVFQEVIAGGQANFDEPVGHLSGGDRALLYAKYNQERHLDELSHAFSQLFRSGKSYGDPLVIDLGCGPFTAGLSLAQTLGNKDVFHYYGVDHYQSMRSLGLELADAAKAEDALHQRTTYHFLQELDGVDFGPIRGSITLFIASYLLASPTLDIAALVRSITDAHTRASLGPAVVFYTNSSRPEARAKFPEFKARLIDAGFELQVDNVERFSDTDKKHLDIHYALFFKKATLTIR